MEGVVWRQDDDQVWFRVRAGLLLGLGDSRNATTALRATAALCRFSLSTGPNNLRFVSKPRGPSPTMTCNP